MARQKVLHAFLLLMCILPLAKADITINEVSSDPSSYQSGQLNQYAITIDFESVNEEYADYFVFDFPAGWSVQFTPGADNPVFSDGCVDPVYTSNGSNRLIVGLDEPNGFPQGGSECGVFPQGIYVFYVDAIVPNSYTVEANVNVTLLGDGFLSEVPANVVQTFSILQSVCSIVCPDNITVDNDPGECNAFVQIPLPTVTGTCSPEPQDMSGTYDVGVHNVEFTANGSNPELLQSCTTIVTVVDAEAPVSNDCEDQLINLDGGECGKVVYYNIAATDNCGNVPFTLSNNSNTEEITNSLACPSGLNTYYQVFDFEENNVYTDVNVSAVRFAVEQSLSSTSITVKIHELVGSFSEDNLVELTSSTLDIPQLFSEFYDFPIFASLEARKKYVVEIITPPQFVSGFVMGFNEGNGGEDTYLKSALCNVNTPELVNSIFPGIGNTIVTLQGTQKSVDVEQTNGLVSGSEFPIGTTTNSFTVTDKNGLTSECSFDIEVVGYESTNSTLACNDNVNVSLDQNCVGEISADMVLEGNNYNCYENYTVVVKDLFGNSYGTSVTSDLIDKELIVEVSDSEGNTCWGKVVIEDKLAPLLECGTMTTQCTQDLTPGANLSEQMRVEFRPNAYISPQGTSVLDIPLELDGFEGATLQDLNIELDIEHSYVSDLGISLISPQGTEVGLTITPGIFCGGNNLELRFDDEAIQSYNDLNNACQEDSIPAIIGSFQPNQSLSSFDGQAVGGTWTLRVSDFANGDGGIVRNVIMELEQDGGTINLPIPANANYTPYGQNTYLVVGLDPCTSTLLKYEDETVKMDCTSPFTKIIYRTYTASDESGNVAVSCMDTIKVLRTDLTTLAFPQNYDDITLPSFSCTAEYPTPEETGYPTGSFCDNVEISHKDVVIDVCEKSYKILREWTVLEWCQSEVVKHTQIIKVIDQEGPAITCPSILAPISTNVNSCEGYVVLPAPKITDNCSENPTYTVACETGNITQNGNGYLLSGLKPGEHIVTYESTDDCGNTSNCSMTVTVVDLIPPAPVCEKQTQVALTFEESAEVHAYTFDDGSYDDCSAITYEARRMNTSCEQTSSLKFQESIFFCCADIGQLQMVEFRVTDANGNSNTCMVEVEVVDKLAPAIELPPNVTIACHDTYENPELTGGFAKAFDNCGAELTYEDTVSPEECGEGTVLREWKAVDPSGNVTFATQIITLVNDDPFVGKDITWPINVTLNNCVEATNPDITGRPILADNVCSQVSATYEDDIFTVVGEACYQILRTWTVIDDCQYNLNSPKLGEGWWKHIQVINIENSTAPEIIGCEDKTVDVFGECEGEVSIAVNATDDCTPANELVYTYKIDLFNKYNGIFEYEGVGSEWTYVLPIGDHRIVWNVSDKCGNISKCEYILTVRDGKAPTPYCLGSLSTAVMSMVGTVEIWATDFDLGAFDNCTKQEDLVISFAKDEFVPVLIYDCDSIPNGVSNVLEVQIWVTDEAGNKDFCTATIKVEDNEANICDDSGSITIGGEIKTIEDAMLMNVDVVAKSQSGDIHTLNTESNGEYSFTLLPGTNYDIKASKEDNYVNGVTTLDIVLIQKHILGLEKLDNPFKIIAADADNNYKVTGSDIVNIRKLILGLTEQFPNEQKSWRMIPKHQLFPNPANPFPYEDFIKVNKYSSTDMDQDLVAIKIGDVNQTSNPNNFTSNVLETRNTEYLNMYVDKFEFEKGDIVELNLRSDEFTDIIAFQTTYEFDPSLVEFVEFTAGELPMTPDNFNFTKLKEGKFSNIWSDSSPKTCSNAILTLRFKALKDGTTTNLLSLTSSITSSIAYNSNYDELKPTVSAIVSNDNSEYGYELEVYQNAPNPFKDETVIKMIVPKRDEITVQIHDVNGQLIKQQKNRYEEGTHFVVISKDDVSQTGVYFYTITGSNNSITKKMILID